MCISDGGPTWQFHRQQFLLYTRQAAVAVGQRDFGQVRGQDWLLDYIIDHQFNVQPGNGVGMDDEGDDVEALLNRRFS